MCIMWTLGLAYDMCAMQRMFSCGSSKRSHDQFQLVPSFKSTLLTGVASEAIVMPLQRVVDSVDGGWEGTAAGVGRSTPGKASVRGIDILDDPPKIFDSQPPAVLAPCDIAGRALA